VGKYTAGAIASIAFNEPSAVVDGNVERVYSRLTCDPATGLQLNTNTWKWAEIHVHQEEPGEWNQAVMELGATVCKPVKPVCHICPVKTECQAFKTNRVEEFPSPKVKPVTIRIKEEIYIPVFENEVGFQKNPEQKWWKGMSLLPLSSTHSNIFEDEWKEELGRFSYTVTNHKITASVQLIRFNRKTSDLQWLSLTELDEVPIPAPHRKALKLYYKT
jgi:A/G-specific adenine glycosylase